MKRGNETRRATSIHLLGVCIANAVIYINKIIRKSQFRQRRAYYDLRREAMMIFVGRL